jgi:hypothetical protein
MACLAKAAEHRLAGQRRVIDQDRAGAGVQFARQRVERLPDLAVGQGEQRAVEAVGDPAA